MDSNINIKVVSLDPGGTTGYAISKYTTDGIVKIAYSQARWIELDLYHFLVTQAPDHVVCESFEYRQAAGDVDYTPVKLWGVVNLFCQLNSSVQLHMQSAAVGKSYWKDHILKQQSLYRASGVQHGRDAARHGLHWWLFRAGGQYWSGNYKKPIFQLVPMERMK